MEIVSKIKNTWIELIIEEGCTKISIDLDSVKEAKILRETLEGVISDIDLYIEKMGNRNLSLKK